MLVAMHLVLYHSEPHRLLVYPRHITHDTKGPLYVEYSGVSQSPWNTYSAGFNLQGKVNRKDWGLNWNAVLAGGGLVASDEIMLTIDLELTKLVEDVAPAQVDEVSA